MATTSIATTVSQSSSNLAQSLNQSNALYSDIVYVIIIAGIISSFIGLRWLGHKLHWQIPIIGKREDFIKAHYIDSTNNRQTQTVFHSQLTLVGKSYLFKGPNNIGTYMFKRESLIRHNQTPEIYYQLGTPTPMNMNPSAQQGIIYDAQELKEAMKSKAIQDLMRVTLTGTDKAVLILVIMNIAVTVIGVIYIYSASESINTLYKAVEQMYNKLFPSTAPALIRYLLGV